MKKTKPVVLKSCCVETSRKDSLKKKCIDVLFFDRAQFDTINYKKKKEKKQKVLLLYMNLFPFLVRRSVSLLELY